MTTEEQTETQTRLTARAEAILAALEKQAVAEELTAIDMLRILALRVAELET